MNSNRNLLVVIGSIVLIAAVAIIVYAASQNSGGPAMDDMKNHKATNSESTDSGDATETDTVKIEGYAYSPATIKVKVGTTVTWTNQDSVAHTVTTQDGAPASIDSGLFGKGESFSYTFEKAGTYEYYCEPHPYMKGTVTVTE